MTTYRTGNAIGSTDPRDLYDNAENLDELVNSQDKLSHPDRLGVPRKTWHGMEEDFQSFLQSSGYQDLGDYAAGIEVTARNQVIRADGELWHLSASVDLPYTTDGSGMPEDGAFVSVGDAVLRQELDGDVATGQGALMVRGAVLYVDTIAGLLSLDTSTLVDGQSIHVSEYHVGEGSGGGHFVWSESEDRSGHNGGTIIAPDKIFPSDWGDSAQVSEWFDGSSGSGCYVREDGISIGTSQFGASSSIPDNVAPIQAALDYAYEYNTTVFNDVECFVSQDLVVKTSFLCRRPIISDESFSGPVVLIDSDTVEELSGMIGDLSGFVEGSTKINGLDGYKNKTINIQSSEIDINRVGYSTIYEKRSTHLITTDDGVLIPPIPFDYDTSLIRTISARGSERPIDVSLWVQIKSQTVDPIARTVVRNRRSFVRLSDLRIENKTENYVPIRQGLSVAACSNVVIDRPKIDGFHYDQLGYAIYLSESSLIEINNGQVTHSRKGIDGFGSDTVKIFGGTYQGPVGSHWGRNYECDSVTVSSGDILPYPGVSTASCFFGAGGGFKLKSCNGSISSVLNPRFFETRADALSLSGDVEISGCEMVCFDCTGTPNIFRFEARTGSADYGRDVISPKNLVLENNSITFDGGVQAVSFLMQDCINDYTVPETLYVSSGSINQDVIFDMSSSAGSCLTDSADYFLSGTGRLTFRCADSTTVRVNATGMVGGILISGQSLSRTVIENSTIDRIWHGGGSTDYREDRVITMNHCRIAPNGNWEARYWYEFKNCRFDGEISWLVVDPTVRVIYTAGNQGAPSSSFDLDGTYRPQ